MPSPRAIVLGAMLGLCLTHPLAIAGWEDMGAERPNAPATSRGTQSRDGASAHNASLVTRGANSLLQETQDEAYYIGAGDILEIEVFGVPELSQTVRVNARGYVKFPLIGAVLAQGLTDERLSDRIAEELSKEYLVDPQVIVFVKEYASHYTLEGLVHKTGMYPLTGPITILEAIAQAGGLSEVAKTNEIVLYRRDDAGKLQEHVFNYDDIRKDLAEDFVLQPNDVVIVNPSMAKMAWRRILGIISMGTLSPYGYTAPGK
jgi:polysaccharide export outer membrane protein